MKGDKNYGKCVFPFNIGMIVEITLKSFNLEKTSELNILKEELQKKLNDCEIKTKIIVSDIKETNGLFFGDVYFEENGGIKVVNFSIYE